MAARPVSAGNGDGRQPATVARLLRTPGLEAVDARALLRHALGWTDAQLLSRAEETVPPPAAAAFAALAARRAAGEPVAYLVGTREFYGLPFRVTPAVLIPRPETELLVDLALERIAPDAACRVLDLGTGSGCVALAIATHRPQARVTAVDCADDALAVARLNAQALGVPGIEFLRSDWFGALQDRRFDLVASNPPYIAAGDAHLRQGDLRHEPQAALAAGADGLECIRAIVAGAAARLAAGGWLLFEHGYDQAARCRALLHAAGFAQVCSFRDLAGIERVSGGRLDGEAG